MADDEINISLMEFKHKFERDGEIKYDRILLPHYISDKDIAAPRCNSAPTPPPK
jgi:hypothetical protein